MTIKGKLNNMTLWLHKGKCVIYLYPQKFYLVCIWCWQLLSPCYSNWSFIKEYIILQMQTSYFFYCFLIQIPTPYILILKQSLSSQKQILDVFWINWMYPRLSDMSLLPSKFFSSSQNNRKYSRIFPPAINISTPPCRPSLTFLLSEVPNL